MVVTSMTPVGMAKVATQTANAAAFVVLMESAVAHSMVHRVPSVDRSWRASLIISIA